MNKPLNMTKLQEIVITVLNSRNINETLPPKFRENILIVDDDILSMEMTSKILKKEGFELNKAFSIQEVNIFGYYILGNRYIYKISFRDKDRAFG